MKSGGGVAQGKNRIKLDKKRRKKKLLAGKRKPWEKSQRKRKLEEERKEVKGAVTLQRKEREWAAG